MLSTKAGDLRSGSPSCARAAFFPSILEPRRRVDQALYAVIMEAYVSGCRPARSTIWSPRWGSTPGSPSREVSRICERLDERVAAFRNRTLGHVEFPYVYLDATYVHVRDDALGQVVSRAVVIATGITAEGGREVLGVDIGDSEDETFWTAFLRSLRPRAGGCAAGDLRRPRRAHRRDPQVLRRCVVAALPGPLRPQPAGHIPKAHQEMVAAAFRSIFALGTATEVRPAGTRSPTPSPSGSPRPPRRCATRSTDVLAFTAFPKRTGARSGRTTRSNA
jgi:putative transposase